MRKIIKYFTLTIVLIPLVSCREGKLESTSMSPSIKEGEKITVNYTAYAAALPERWDIVAYTNDETKGRTWVQRIVGLPGETVDIQDSFVVINGTKLQYPKKIASIRYAPLQAGEPTKLKLPYTLPMGTYFVLGDNTSQAIDSRYIGHINQGDIKGRVEENN